MSRDDWPTANCRGCMDADSEHVEVDGDEWCRDCLEKSVHAALEEVRNIVELVPIDELPRLTKELDGLRRRFLAEPT